MNSRDNDPSLFLKAITKGLNLLHLYAESNAEGVVKDKDSARISYPNDEHVYEDFCNWTKEKTDKNKKTSSNKIKAKVLLSSIIKLKDYLRKLMGETSHPELQNIWKDLEVLCNYLLSDAPMICSYSKLFPLIKNKAKLTLKEKYSKEEFQPNHFFSAAKFVLEEIMAEWEKFKKLPNLISQSTSSTSKIVQVIKTESSSTKEEVKYKEEDMLTASAPKKDDPETETDSENEIEKEIKLLVNLSNNKRRKI